MIQQRASGILAHISSLPSAYGIGDIGRSGQRFLNFLAEAEQLCWQFLPTGPTHPLVDNSPYMSLSAFAGSSLLICPELLHEEGLLPRQALTPPAGISPYATEYAAVRDYKQQLLQEAFTNFQPEDSLPYQTFVSTSPWLEEYALFMSLKESFQGAGWFAWPQQLATREPAALEKAAGENSQRMAYYRFEQFIFFQQWQALHRTARGLGIELFGDLPIYVGYDSADVWANQRIFALDRNTLRPQLVSGVPPDYFSATGQRWGNPLYDWQNAQPEIREALLDWWCDRLAHLFTMVDIARIDHFRGFAAYWAIPEEEETAEKGHWLPGPGKDFFAAITGRLGELNIVAEDLGVITPDVEALRDELGFPGMKILQFAFDGSLDNPYLPHNFTTSNCLVYTGTHDNNTTVGWFLGDIQSEERRDEIRRLTNRRPGDREDIHRDLIYLAQASISRLCIFPLQDILGFGGDCKMNSPGVATGNWRWRCPADLLSSDRAEELRISTRLFGRGRRAAETEAATGQKEEAAGSEFSLPTAPD